MKIKVVVGSAILVLMSCNMALAQWPVNTHGGNPSWEVEFGTRIMDRPVDRNDPAFGLITDNLTLATLFNSQDAADLNTSAGVDLRVSRNNGYHRNFEFRGYYNEWERFQQVTGDLRSPLLLGVALSNVDYFYNSQIYNLEFNFKQAVRPGVTLLIGPRFLYLEENAIIDTTIPGLATILRTTTETDNPMIGLNFGGEVRRPIGRGSHILGWVKGAVFANAAEANVNVQTVVQPGNVILASTPLLAERVAHASALLEFGGRVHFDIVPGNISVYVGYEGTWLDGVALAPAQLLVIATPAANTIHTSSTPFIHGLVVGGTIRY